VNRDRVNTPIESGRDERDRLRQQVRRLSERNHRVFDEGFAAALKMVEQGADLEQLRAAAGVVAGEWEDTLPTSVREDAEVIRAIAREEWASSSKFDNTVVVDEELEWLAVDTIVEPTRNRR
jgi:hypothetical protein